MFTTSKYSWYKLEYYFLRAQVVVFSKFSRGSLGVQFGYTTIQTY